MVYIIDVSVYTIWRSTIESIAWDEMAVPISIAIIIAIITIHGVIDIATASIPAVVAAVDIAIAVVIVIPS